MRVLAVSEAPIAGELSLRPSRDGGAKVASTAKLHEGPPWFVALETRVETAGSFVAELTQPACGGTEPASARVEIGRHGRFALPNPKAGVWPVRRARGTASSRTITLHGSSSSSTRRMRTCRAGARSTRCCGIRRRTRSSIASARARTSPAAPLVRPDCANIRCTLGRTSRGSSGSPSGSARATAAAEATRPRARVCSRTRSLRRSQARTASRPSGPSCAAPSPTAPTPGRRAPLRGAGVRLLRRAAA